MKASALILNGLILMALTACSTQEIKQDTKPITAEKPIKNDVPPQKSGQNPPLTHMKGDKTLNLVKMMDGGACKNDFQGAKGSFLVYADAADIERIKHGKGTQVFSDFEDKIQIFSTAALQEAIAATNLAEDPFSLGADEAQEKLTKELSGNFRNSVAQAINAFQNETSLTIDIVPFAPSFTFYQQGCDAAHMEQEN